jgi:hypothetical protein
LVCQGPYFQMTTIDSKGLHLGRDVFIHLWEASPEPKIPSSESSSQTVFSCRRQLRDLRTCMYKCKGIFFSSTQLR